MEFQVKILTDVAEEPITLSEVKAFLRIDEDYASDDSILEMLMTSAREKLEGYTNLAFGVKELEVMFDKVFFNLPYGPTVEILSVEKNGEELAEDKYKITGLTFKSLNMQPELFSNIFYFDSGAAPEIFIDVVERDTFIVKYLTGYAELPVLLKQALLTQVNYEYKSLGEDSAKALSPVAMQLANRYSQNLAIC